VVCRSGRHSPRQAAGQVFALRIARSARGPQSTREVPMPDNIRCVGLDVHLPTAAWINKPKEVGAAH
jgi:hypothetical protein